MVPCRQRDAVDVCWRCLAFDSNLIHPSDGVITPDDLAQGRSFDEIPTGSVSVIPIPETVNGTFVVDSALVVGDRFDEPRVAVDAGRVARVDGAAESTPFEGISSLLAALRFRKVPPWKSR